MVAFWNVIAHRASHSHLPATMPRRFPSLRFQAFAFLSALALLCSPAVRAMSVVAPTFTQLVAASDNIVRGTVTAIRAEEFDSAQGRGIRTLVTLRVERTLKGTTADTVTLTFLGGTVGRRTLTVAGMPRFTVGGRQLVFVARNGAVLCPLVAAAHGRYHVLTDAATQRDYVTRDNGAPLTSTDEIALPLAGPGIATVAARAVSSADALSLSAFEARIADTVAPGTPSERLP